MPFAYIPKSLANTARSKPVTDIYLCALPPGAISDSPNDARMTNHWVMHLAVSATQSICFDPSPTGPGNSLDLIITSGDCSYTGSAVKTTHLTCAANLTVGDILDRITKSKYDKYVFSAEGQGCRFWLYSVVLLLRSAGYITDESEVDTSNDALKLVWTDLGDRAPAGQQTGITEGTF